MAFEAQNIFTYLAKNYGGMVATRALWQWAGGSPADVVYENSAIERWAVMWEKASEDDKLTSVSLVREALFDQPGNPLLMAYLDSLSDETFGEARISAKLIYPLIESLSPEFIPSSLWPLLQAFPEISAQQTFVALAPLLQKKIDIKARLTLEDRLRFLLEDEEADEKPKAPEVDAKVDVKTPSAKDLVESLKIFLKHILKAVKKANTQDYVDTAKELVMHLEMKPSPPSEENAEILDEPPLGLLGSKFELPPDKAPPEKKLLPGEELTQRIEPVLQRLKKLAEISADPGYVAAIAGVERQILSLTSGMNGKPVPVASAIAEGAIQSLWASHGIIEKKEPVK